MRTLLSNLFTRIATGLAKSLYTPQQKNWNFPLPASRNTSSRRATDLELAEEVHGTVYSCASMNASVCAFHPPKLYKKDNKGPGSTEVFEHPLLELFKQVNPVHNAHDLWELTTFDQELFGSAYWLIDEAIETGLPDAIWPLPAHLVKPMRERDSIKPVDWYEIRRGGNIEKIHPGRIIHFRYPDPRDPYGAGLSPLRACKESASLQALLLSTKKSIYENHALPGVILSPEEPMHENERDRLEAIWNARFRNQGNGKILVADGGMKVQPLSPRLGDPSSLLEAAATRDDIANAFGIPLAFLTKETNLANLRAAERQHLAKAIRPRLRRRDEKLNEQLLPRFDKSQKLFLATPDPLIIE